MPESPKLVEAPSRPGIVPGPETLFTSRPEQAQSLLFLYEVSREITSILDRDELFRRVAERVKKIVNYHVFSVMLWNERTAQLETVFNLQYDDAIPSRFRVPLFQGITGHAAGHRTAIRVNDVRSDKRYIECDNCELVRSALAVPLLLQDRMLGVIDLESTELNAFTEEHERMLTTIASYMAVAVENSRLFTESRENELRLQADLDTAREIQLQLLPRGAREVPGVDIAASYIPARELAGDFYDFIPYGKGNLAIALGDVSGKGTAAALYGSLAIGVLREHANDATLPPAEMLSLLNRRLHASRLDARFIALLFAVYNVADRRLTMANAGSPRPILFRDGEIREVPIEGVPLGLFPNIDYDVRQLDLHSGDVVVLASDGILESMNDNEEEFGLARLAETLRHVSPEATAADISSAILGATDRFSGRPTEPHDDRTMVILKVTADVLAEKDWSKLPVIF